MSKKRNRGPFIPPPKKLHAVETATAAPSLETAVEREYKERRIVDSLFNAASQVTFAVPANLALLHAANVIAGNTSLNAVESVIHQYAPTLGYVIAGASIVGIYYNRNRNLVPAADRTAGTIHITTNKLLTTNTYGVVRHPLYAMQRLFDVGCVLASPTIPVVLTAAAHVGLTELTARREETTMELRYGQQYRDYAANTPRWMPDLVPGGAWNAAKYGLKMLFEDITDMLSSKKRTGANSLSTENSSNS